MEVIEKNGGLGQAIYLSNYPTKNRVCYKRSAETEKSL